MSHNPKGETQPPERFAARRRDASPAGVSYPGVPDKRTVFAEELARIEARIRKVRAGGRENFRDGEEHYDIASMAIVRLAALFEEKGYAEFLNKVAGEEAAGIAATRNFAAHSGYRRMNDNLFWESVTVHAPAFIAKVREANGLH